MADPVTASIEIALATIKTGAAVARWWNSRPATQSQNSSSGESGGGKLYRSSPKDLLYVIATIGQWMVHLDVIHLHTLPVAREATRTAFTAGDPEDDDLGEVFDAMDIAVQYAVTCGMVFCAECWPMRIYNGFGCGVFDHLTWGDPDKPNFYMIELDASIAALKSQPHTWQLLKKTPDGISKEDPDTSAQKGSEVKKHTTWVKAMFKDWEKNGFPQPLPPYDHLRVGFWRAPFATWNGATMYGNINHDVEPLFKWQQDPGRYLWAWTAGKHSRLAPGEALLLPGESIPALALWFQGLNGITFRVLLDNQMDHSKSKITKDHKKYNMKMTGNEHGLKGDPFIIMYDPTLDSAAQNPPQQSFQQPYTETYQQQQYQQPYQQEYQKDYSQQYQQDYSQQYVQDYSQQQQQPYQQQYQQPQYQQQQPQPLYHHQQQQQQSQYSYQQQQQQQPQHLYQQQQQPQNLYQQQQTPVSTYGTSQTNRLSLQTPPLSPADPPRYAEAIQSPVSPTPVTRSMSYGDKPAVRRRPIPQLPPVKLRTVIAIHSAIPESEEELAFEKGDIIEILDDKSDDGWWKAQLRGKIGVIPYTFVEDYKQDTKPPPQQPAVNVVETQSTEQVPISATTTIEEKPEPTPVPAVPINNSAGGAPVYPITPPEEFPRSLIPSEYHLPLRVVKKGPDPGAQPTVTQQDSAISTTPPISSMNQSTAENQPPAQEYVFTDRTFIAGETEKDPIFVAEHSSSSQYASSPLFTKVDAPEAKKEEPAVTVQEVLEEEIESREWSVSNSAGATPIIARTLQYHNKAVKAVAFSPTDPGTLASGGERILIWNYKSGQTKNILYHEGGVEDICFAPDGTVLAAGGENNIIKIWDIRTREAVHTLKEESSGGVKKIQFSPDGNTIAAAFSWGRIHLYDRRTMSSSIQKVKAHKTIISGLHFSPDGSALASTSYDKTVKTWETATGNNIQNIKAHSGMLNYVETVRYSPNGRLLASGALDSTIKLWVGSSGALLKKIKMGNHVQDLRFSADGSMIVAGTLAGLSLVNVGKGDVLHSQNVEKGLLCVDISPDGKLVASGGPDKSVRVWKFA